MRTGFKRLLGFTFAFLSLIIGIAAGLQRIGWDLGVVNRSTGHGVIMVSGFLGTLVVLEKITTKNRQLLYVLPFISGISALLFFADAQQLSLLFLVAASSLIAIMFLVSIFKEQSVDNGLMLASAVCWTVGNYILLKTMRYPAALPWWISFVVFAVIKARLDASRFADASLFRKMALIASFICLLLGCITPLHIFGKYFTSFGLVLTSLWLLRYDVVATKLKDVKLTRYVGLSLLCGYFSLLSTGILLLLLSNKLMGYDIIVHNFFIGFAFSMIFARGPIVLHRVLGNAFVPYSSIMYVWLSLLHLSLVMRFFADLQLLFVLRKYSGVVTAMAIVGYFVTLAFQTTRTSRAKVV